MCLMRLLAVLIAASPFFASAQTPGQARRDPASETEKRVAALNNKFADLMVVTPSEKEWIEACKVDCAKASPRVREESRMAAANRVAGMDRVAERIHSEVDAYIAPTVNPDRFDAGTVARNLKRILAHAYDEPPSAFVLNSASGRSLLIVYKLTKGGMMGPGATSVALRVYSPWQGRFVLADAARTDMDGYGRVFARELHSPAPGEIWLLVRGQMTGANGPNIRMRVYACDGKKFRTMWMPENVRGAFTIRVTANGFTVDGTYYRENAARHDEYAVAPDGLYRLERRRK